MLPRLRGSREVIKLTRALRALLRRVGFAEERTRVAELRESENAKQFAHDLRTLRELADTDPLTHLMNRRSFLEVGHDAMHISSGITARSRHSSSTSTSSRK
jgi:GGDEF domain-containing protein